MEPLIFEKFPGLLIGAVSVTGLDNHGENADSVQRLRREQERIRADWTMETLAGSPRILAWRKAYSSFGAKPKKHSSSVEALFRMTLKKIDLKHINKVVDIYNAISLKYMVPVGGDDLAKVEGGVHLRFARGDEPFTPLNSSDREKARKGEFVYAADKEVTSRGWIWRKVEKSKMR